MPISIQPHGLATETQRRFAKVLSDQSDFRQSLERAIEAQRGRLFAAHFNGQPVALALLDDRSPRLHWLVVHPATRGRGVGRDLLELIQGELGEAPLLPEHCQQH